MGYVVAFLFVSPFAKADDIQFSNVFRNFNRSANSVDRLRQVEQELRASSGVKAVLGQDRSQSLAIDREANEFGIASVRFQHYYQGLEVVGSVAVHHQGNAGLDIQNELVRFDLDVTPAISAEQAVAIARSYLDARDLSAVPVLKILPSDNADNSARLIYSIDLQASGADGGHLLFVNAKSGELIADLPKNLPIAPINVYSAAGQGGGPFLDFFTPDTRPTPTQCQVLDLNGAPAELNPTLCPQVVKNSVALATADATARRALDNSTRVLSYYLNTHRRDSYDAAGASITNVVHVGIGFDNAFWNSDKNMMAYGDGDGKELGDFTRALDVAGHEMTHGVTSRTAKLVYKGESGALNEAFSDFFGKMIAQDGDWTIGKEIFLNPGPDAGIRDLANPGRFQGRVVDPSTGVSTKRPYPASVAEAAPIPAVCARSNDNCYVHYNSTVASHAFYELYRALGKDKSERLLYVALTGNYVNMSTGFRTIGPAVLGACKQLFDNGTCDGVRSVLAQSGL